MMGGIREYLLSIAAAGVLATLAEAVMPAGAVKRVVRFLGGLIVLLSAISPLTKLASGRNPEIANWEMPHSDLVVYAEQQTKELTEMLIIERTAEYILDKAEQIGMKVTAEVILENKDLNPVPRSITITGIYTQLQKKIMSDYLEQTFGIPEERQVWRSCENRETIS